MPSPTFTVRPDLLANDTDANVSTDNQTMSISAVGNANNGTVSIVNGTVLFTLTLSFNGMVGTPGLGRLLGWPRRQSPTSTAITTCLTTLAGV